jgi:hypothetical protein
MFSLLIEVPVVDPLVTEVVDEVLVVDVLVADTIGQPFNVVPHRQPPSQED